MTKKLVFLTFVALALMVGGCSKQNPFDAQSDNGVDQVSLEKQQAWMPIKGHFETVIETFYPIEFVNGQPTKFGMHIVGKGYITHIGFCTVAFDQTADFSVIPNTLSAPNVVVTTSTGEELHFSSSGISNDDGSGNPKFSGEFIFTGGTGSYSNASGKALFTGSASLSTMTGEFSFAGRITY